MTTILALDPGDVWTGWVLLRDGDEVLDAGTTDDRDELLRLARLTGRLCSWLPIGKAFIRRDPVPTIDAVAIENIEPRFGQTQGWEVFDTARFVGRLQEAFLPLPVTLRTRSEVLASLGINTRRRKGQPKVNADSTVRTLLIERWGGAGSEKRGGPLHGVTSHAWQALAVAVCAEESGA